MQLEWLGNYRYLVEKMIKYGNAYARTYCRELSYGTECMFSAAELQTLEYVLENEDKHQNMAEIAMRLGVSRSAFSRNVKQMINKGLLEKYHSAGNRKDVIIQASMLGRETYEKYCLYERDVFFNRILSQLDNMPSENIAAFANMLDMIADDLLFPPEDSDNYLIKIE